MICKGNLIIVIIENKNDRNRSEKDLERFFCNF